LLVCNQTNGKLKYKMYNEGINLIEMGSATNLKGTS